MERKKDQESSVSNPTTFQRQLQLVVVVVVLMVLSVGCRFGGRADCGCGVCVFVLRRGFPFLSFPSFPSFPSFFPRVPIAEFQEEDSSLFFVLIRLEDDANR